MTEKPSTDSPRPEDSEAPEPATAAGPGGASTDGVDGAEAADPAGPAAAGTDPTPSEQEPEEPPIVVRDKRRVDPNGDKPKPAADEAKAKPAEEAVAEPSAAPESGPELDELRKGLDELTRDLQRVTAEYANYRKRVDRDRTLVAEQATGTVLTQLLPVLDDLDRARSHGDLVGPFATVAEQLSAALGKFGLSPFGDVGDPFDPTLHEAVSHTSSPDVTETSCIEIMRRGYLLGERLLRPALVAVADPE